MTGKATTKATKSPNADVWHWLGFSAIIGIVPILFSYVVSLGGQPRPLSELLSHGELLVVCIALSGEAIGDMYKNRQSKSEDKAVIFWFCFGIFMASCLGFGAVAGGSVTFTQVEIMDFSLSIFLMTVFVGAASKRRRK